MNECIVNLERSTRTSSHDEFVTRESLHPLWPRCEYTGDVIFEGCKAIRINWDPTLTDSEWKEGVSLSFYLDEEADLLIRTFDHANPVESFIVQSDKLYFKFTSKLPAGDMSQQGFCFRVSPLRGLSVWKNEEQVLRDPSLKWASWLMMFLMRSSEALSREVHDPNIFAALVQYMRSPNAPFKERIVSLLTQLCKEPHLFSTMPNLRALRAVARTIMNRADAVHKESIFLPQRLLSLVELAVTVELCTRKNGTSLLGVSMDPTVPVTVPLTPPVDVQCSVVTTLKELDALPTLKVLTDVYLLAKSIHDNKRLPDELLCSAWLNSLGHTADQADARRKLRKNRRSVEQMARAMAIWTPSMDTELVQWINMIIKKQGGDPLKLQNKLKLTESVFNDFPLLRGLSSTEIMQRFGLLRVFNARVAKVLCWIDFNNVAEEWSMGNLVQKLNHCLFYEVKRRFLEEALEKTWGNEDGSGLTVKLDQMKAERSMRSGDTSVATSDLLFVQLYRSLHTKPSVLLRSKLKPTNSGRGSESLFIVQYALGEGLDWGGVYRDALNTAVERVFSPSLNLLILTPNGRQHVGQNQSSYVPNVGQTSEEVIRMFEFLGKLMGISLRTEGFFPFKFPHMIYKLILGRRITLADLATVDFSFAGRRAGSPRTSSAGKGEEDSSKPMGSGSVRWLDRVRLCEDYYGINDAQSFDEKLGALAGDAALRFTYVGSDGRTRPLIEGGAGRYVTFRNRHMYCELYDDYRLHEFDQLASAIRRGISTIVPLLALQYLTPEEFETAVCGDPFIDVSLLKANTKYCGYNESDEICRRFWRVMESLSEKQKVNFVKYAWGRSRLPTRNSKEHWIFRLTRPSRANNDVNRLPEAHTCFFQIMVPQYTSDAQMRKKLVTAIDYGLGAMTEK